MASIIAWDVLCLAQADNGIHGSKVFMLHMLYLACFVTAAKTRETGGAGALAGSLIALGITAAGYGYYCLGGEPSLPEYAGRMSGPFVSPNHFAALVAMITIILAEHALQPRQFYPRAMLITATVMGGGAVLLSGSRIVLIAFLGAMALLLIRTRARFAIACLLLAVLVGLLWLPMGGMHRLTHGFGDAGMLARVAVWYDTLEMIADNPWGGVGLGNFEWVYPQYRSVGITRKVDFAHSDALQLCAEQGFVGLLLWGLFLFEALRRRRSGGSPGMALALGMLLGVAICDFPLQLPAVGMVFFCLLGVQLHDQANDCTAGRVFSRMGIIALLALCLAVAAKTAVSQAYAMAGIEARRFLQWDKAIQHLRAATRWQAQNPMLWRAMGKIGVRRYLFGRKTRAADASQAENCFRRALAIHPRDAAAWVDLGLLLLHSGRDTEARECLSRALALDPRNAFFHDMMAKAWMMQHRYALARLHAEMAVWLYRRDGVAAAMLGKMERMKPGAL